MPDTEPVRDEDDLADDPADDPADELVDGLWDTDPDGTPHLLGGRCDACGRSHFPCGPRCPWCGGEPVALTRLPRHGTLWGWTTVTTAPPGYEGPVPFGFGVVELDDGLRVVTRLTGADPSALAFGRPMVLVLDGVGPDGAPPRTWAFTPTGEAGR